MTIFFISDTHFGHANFLTFRDEEGQLIRPFSSVEEMNELMVERWNEVVRDGDKIYHLGDVAWSGNVARSILPRLRGRKRLVLGNHDDIRDHRLLDYFEKVSLWRLFKDEGFVCSHIPLPKEEMRHASFNVHGHIHERMKDDLAYINICVEKTDYRPVSLDEIQLMIRIRQVRIDLRDGAYAE